MIRSILVWLLVTLGCQAAFADSARDYELTGELCTNGDAVSIAFIERVQIHTPYVNQGLMILPITINGDARVLYWEIVKTPQGTECSGVIMIRCLDSTPEGDKLFESRLCAEAHSSTSRNDGYGYIYMQFDAGLHSQQICTHRSAASLTFNSSTSIHTPFIWSDRIIVPIHTDNELRILWWNITVTEERSSCDGVFEQQCDTESSRFERRACTRAHGSF